MDKPTIQVGSKKIEIWPEGQSLAVKVDPTIRVTRFDDIDDYHPGLIARFWRWSDRGRGSNICVVVAAWGESKSITSSDGVC